MKRYSPYIGPFRTGAGRWQHGRGHGEAQARMGGRGPVVLPPGPRPPAPSTAFDPLEDGPWR
jgi:hypothetical protein